VTTITGTAGTTWSNDTGVVVYQFLAALRHTCGRCLQHHTRIAPWWGIPLHPRCQCAQLPIAPGAAAPFAFVNFRTVFASLDASDKKEAVGASVYQLVKAGLVALDRVVLADRVRDLWEVVAMAKLDEEDMIRAGVQASVAREAVENAHASEELHAERQERRRIAEAAGAAMAQAAVANAISAGHGVAFVAVPAVHGIALAAAAESWRPERRRTTKGEARLVAN
jgi:hypothetical protein